jgi:hypothetical protein
LRTFLSGLMSRPLLAKFGEGLVRTMTLIFEATMFAQSYGLCT